MNLEIDAKKVMLLVSAEDLRKVIFEMISSIKEQGIEKKNEMDERLTPNEVVERYKVSKPTLWRWGKAGLLSQTKLGGKRFYLKSEIEKMLKY